MVSGAVYQHLFTRVPSEHFHSPELAFEFLQLCRDSLPLFGRSLGVLKLSFPNLFKARKLVPGPEWGAGGGGRAGGQCPGLSPPPQGLRQVLAVTTGPRAGDLECRAEGEVRGIPGCPRVTGKQLRRQAEPCAEPLRRPDLWLSSHKFVQILASSSAWCGQPFGVIGF